MVLRTRGLTKRFGGVTAVDGVDFELGEETCSLIGPNGAGKTTFFNLLTGVLSPTSGRVEYRDPGERGGGHAEGERGGGHADGERGSGHADGERGSGHAGDADGADWVDVTGADPHETALAGVHRSYQITNIFGTSTVLENVRIAAQAHGGADSWKAWRNVDAFPEYEREAYRILERVDLADEAETTAETLSHGEKRNLEVAIALAGDPDVLLLDEPTAGISSDGIDDLTALIDDIAADHAVLLVEHNMDVVMEVSDRIAVLHQGSLIADDEPRAIRESQRVQDAYLGGYEPGEAGANDRDPEESAGGEAA